MFDSLSLEEAVRLFKQWGFEVEPGPRPAEVTLIQRGPDFVTHTVYDAAMLPAIAAEALRIRWQSGLLSARGLAGRVRPAQPVPYLSGAASLLRQ